ncbi:tRNA (adenine(58)-N(1))-methyltransferase [Lachnellula hyalina]|uniref:tRNA (adenine(58)-N(1))-methyltransferase catalytic subunit TRM61 n=1 Tax=Lachnellula hyalina TaxID=1316788 RepID=A0A8H8TXS1_9HELO|nr:tRNA (adenine(58)-N(1))-methyltransferase [Lachnellula hyalina]TVY26349.1 tRNA (adenine(58)-N(1))-methyltransferase [Lachnellula hyalina]
MASLKPIITLPLRPRDEVKLAHDKLFHNDIIGRRIRDTLSTRKRRAFRVTDPTLAEYTDLTPRIVTPIYSQDAAAIVSLLDLNPTVPGTDDEKLEIFEAGTGHGALTLHLARAIHAANTAPPPKPEKQSDAQTTDSQGEAGTDVADQQLEAYTAWLKSRRAIIQTLDNRREHSEHAQNTIKNYRNGMYYHNIDFHVGTIEQYISSRLSKSPTPFLSHAILDLPDTHTYFKLVAKALKPNASLLVFCPSITQINTCALDVRKNGTPLFLEKVVELGAAIGVGGREWDVRPVRPRAFLKARAEAAERGQAAVEDSAEAVEQSEEDGWELVCRPKVGQRISGGGFVGLWKKMFIE